MGADFYQRRIPKYNRLSFVIEFFLVAGTIVAATISAFDLAHWTALVAAIIALFMSWRSFFQADKKLSRYANTLEKINVINSWWESLDSIEKSNADNIQQLVDTSEEILHSEWEAWCSIATKTNTQLKSYHSSADQDGSEQLNSLKEEQ